MRARYRSVQYLGPGHNTMGGYVRVIVELDPDDQAAVVLLRQSLEAAWREVDRELASHVG